MDLVQRCGEQAALLSWGDYHHHIGLNTWHSQRGTPSAKHHTGLFHVALLYPRRDALVAAARRVAEAGFDIYGHADHGLSIALYFDDPDGNGVETYWDKPREEWRRHDDGSLKIVNERFELAPFLAGAG